jgi:hypothetical protein
MNSRFWILDFGFRIGNACGRLFSNPKSKIQNPKWFAVFAAFLSCLSIPGCILRNPDPATPRVTNIDPKLSTPNYWLDQPAVVHVDAPDFYTLWQICRSVAHDRFFMIDREEYREGLMTTRPLVSKMYWEIWRRDEVTVDDIEASTLATIRRTVYFRITQQPNGKFTVEPKVLVERFASSERRLTAINEYLTAFAGPRPYGTTEMDEGVTLPTDYWYATGRDNALERDLAAAIRRRLPTS